MFAAWGGQCYLIEMLFAASLVEYSCFVQLASAWQVHVLLCMGLLVSLLSTAVTRLPATEYLQGVAHGLMWCAGCDQMNGMITRMRHV